METTERIERSVEIVGKIGARETHALNERERRNGGKERVAGQEARARRMKKKCGARGVTRRVVHFEASHALAVFERAIDGHVRRRSVLDRHERVGERIAGGCDEVRRASFSGQHLGVGAMREDAKAELVAKKRGIAGVVGMAMREQDAREIGRRESDRAQAGEHREALERMAAVDHPTIAGSAIEDPHVRNDEPAQAKEGTGDMTRTHGDDAV